LERLQRFQFEVIYRKGHKNADGLLRRQCESSGCKYCSKVEQKDIQAHSVTVAQIILPERNLKDWRREQREDSSSTKNLCGMKTGEHPSRFDIGSGDVSVRIYWLLSYYTYIYLYILYKR